ncbi:uncharacterized protein LOC126370427 [Pectinophora gossypiella]|uniref:uncharacterized protein LOC126370427 n=1 Tax=Pectinophora gossypiella TaxID=13191 RepID=UPI00214E735B|nr:uncharacterized protein LOC126370427 [Pectinophora gossypiella]
MEIWEAWVTKTKNKARKIRGHIAATGGGPPISGLTDIEERILFVVGTASVYGFTDEEVGIAPPAAAGLRPAQLERNTPLVLPGPSTSRNSPPLGQSTTPPPFPVTPSHSRPIPSPELQQSTRDSEGETQRSRLRNRSRQSQSRRRPPVNDNLIKSLNENNKLLRQSIITASSSIAGALISLGEANIRAAEIIASAIQGSVALQQHPLFEEEEVVDMASEEP